MPSAMRAIRRLRWIWTPGLAPRWECCKTSKPSYRRFTKAFRPSTGQTNCRGGSRWWPPMATSPHASSPLRNGTLERCIVGFFQTFWTWLNHELASYIGATTAQMASILEPAVVTFATIYVMVWGYLHLTGKIDEPI